MLLLFLVHLALPPGPQIPCNLLPISSLTALPLRAEEAQLQRVQQAAWLLERSTKNSMVAEMGYRAPHTPQPLQNEEF